MRRGKRETPGKLASQCESAQLMKKMNTVPGSLALDLVWNTVVRLHFVLISILTRTRKFFEVVTDIFVLPGFSTINHT